MAVTVAEDMVFGGRGQRHLLCLCACHRRSRHTIDHLPVMPAVPLGRYPRHAHGPSSRVSERPRATRREPARRVGHWRIRGGADRRGDPSGPGVAGDRPAALRPAAQQRAAAPGNVKEALAVAAPPGFRSAVLGPRQVRGCLRIRHTCMPYLRPGFCYAICG